MKDLTMTPYEMGGRIATGNLHQEKQAETYPEEYAAAGSLGHMAGGLTGAFAGGAGGAALGKMLGEETRKKFIVPIPGTGIGESMFGRSPGPIIGGALGALGGGALGAAMGKPAGQLMALNKGGHPHRVAQPAVPRAADGSYLTPELLAYLSQG